MAKVLEAFSLKYEDTRKFQYFTMTYASTKKWCLDGEGGLKVLAAGGKTSLMLKSL